MILALGVTSAFLLCACVLIFCASATSLATALNRVDELEEILLSAGGVLPPINRAALRRAVIEGMLVFHRDLYLRKVSESSYATETVLRECLVDTIVDNVVLALASGGRSG